nr:hypothetical protein [Pelagicoccus enzymogenes]
MRYGKAFLELAGSGSSPANSSPLTCIVVDQAYEVELSLEMEGDAEGGIFLFYNPRAYVGLGFTGEKVRTYQYAESHDWASVPLEGRKVRARLTNDRNVITYHYSIDGGKTWRLHPTRMEVSGMHHNVFGGFLSLRIGICSLGTGTVRLSDFRYRALV